MAVETRKVIGVFPSKRKGWTKAGREAVDELERWLRLGKERLGEWVADDPAKAFAYTAGAGAAILLMDDLYPEFALLGQQLAERRAAAGGGGEVAPQAPEVDPSGIDTGALGTGLGGTDPGGLDPGALGLGGTDPGALDLGALELDLGGFDGLEAAFSAIDTGVDAGGGGDGGGGGGDGGGGG